MQSSSTFLDVERVMQRVRAELAKRQPGSAGVQPMPAAAAAQSVGMPRPAPVPGGQIAMGDLLAFHDREFIHRAYQGVLGRTPDMDGERTFLDLLRSGRLTKAEVIGRLRYSPEGRGRRIRVTGLLPSFVLHTLLRLPVLGFVLGWINGLLRLPVLVRNFQAMEAHSHFVHTRLQDQLSAQAEEIARLRAALREQVDREGRRAINGDAATASEFNQFKQSCEQDVRALSAEILAIRSTAEKGLERAHQVQAERIDAIAGQCRQLELSLRKDAEQQQAQIASLGMALERADGRLDALAEQVERAEVESALSATNAVLHARIEGAQTAADELGSEPELAHLRESLQRESDERQTLDAFYLDFEDRFRGSRDLVKQRAAHYLPIVAACEAGTELAPILDIGCGRGEWLELLGEHGRHASGIDLNENMLAECRSRGLQVQQADALRHLAALPEGSLGAITAIHVVEHLRFAELIQLADLCLRALRPGGVLIFETPNPENVKVGACNFYMDPTHANPLPPPLLDYMLQSRGFARTAVQRLSEARGDSMALSTLPEDANGDAQVKDRVNAVVATLNQLVHTAPDYAVVAYKA